MSSVGISSPGSLQKLAATPLAGFPLQNAGPTILSYTFPNDGQQHRVECFASKNVTVAETGGAIQQTITNPAGVVGFHNIFSGGSGVGDIVPNQPVAQICQPGSTVSIIQTPLTLGASTVWAELWGN